ncbi:SUMF1/EgtB/PvdO family nonheme iron enzyme [Virgibacillus halodenitrificans]|uniref:SUMF1/EgtB/PvdO family nonheme iron enzyme n=1 Tax=Virgibacillus halodenitrificans TaxID=1482 RepID=UPI00136F3593|nr:SUMF1/EgtB/PvdO family nonheme iron enzyme [Virgibacillus halodenitrificans]MYL45068.1 SUMF1/EgtB/PvdO family nonheme iron enzyme [Virgibacillus halodenitrificans]
MSFILSVKDTYRQAVEAATDGKNTVMYDDKGNPSIMVCIPRFNLSDVIDGAPNTPHPAFIVNGVVKNEIWISKFQNIIHDERAYSIPGVDPATFVDFGQAKNYCANKGQGWHLMTNAEWAAIALWSKKNGTMPRGNNNYGSDHSAPYERGRQTSVYDNQTGRVATGSGPASWSHDHTNTGIFDLNGNVREWVDGFKLIDGKIYVHNDNDYETPEDIIQWVDTGAAFDVEGGNLVLNSTVTTTMDEASEEYKETQLESLVAATGYTVPELLKYLAIAPYDIDHGKDMFYVRNYGERLPQRGGSSSGGRNSGVFHALLYRVRTDSHPFLGFRSVFIS